MATATRALAFAVGVLVSGIASADNPSIVVLEYENDAFVGRDGGYSNGMGFTVIPGEQPPPGWLLAAAQLFPAMPSLDDDNALWAWSLAQTIFTPHDIDEPEFPPDDRPYAGWLNSTLTVGKIDAGRMDRVRLGLGLIGPASLAGYTQRGIHRLIGTNDPLGWERQLPNEPTLQVSYDRQWRLNTDYRPKGRALEIAPTVGVTVGNALTGAELGGFLRWGKNLPEDFGPPRISSIAGGSGYFRPTAGAGWYLYSGAAASYIPHNIFLDGSLFQDMPSVARKPFLGEIYFGFALYNGSTRLTYTQVVRSRAFDNQPARDDFGAVSLSWDY